MSVLIVAGHAEVDGLLARRLSAQGDIVGMVVEDAGTAEGMDLGQAHIAVGPRTDEDLVERAATHARTIVVFVSRSDASRDGLEAAITAATRLGGLRLVVWGPNPQDVAGLVRGSGLPYVVIRTGPLGSRFRKTVPPATVAEAIDAADDLAGDVRLELDLRRPEDRDRLRLEPPA